MEDIPKTVVVCTALITAIIKRRKKRKKRIRKVREKEWLKRRSGQGVYKELLEELRLEEPNDYRKYLRMDVTVFEELLEKVTPFIDKKATQLREPIAAGERLAVTLRFLSTGETYQSLQYQFRISASALSLIIPDVCKAILHVLKDEHFSCPRTAKEWRQIAELFKERWQLPNCIGAADGKHIRILHPKNTGSQFYNYKGFYSIVLMAVVDADYKFTFCDVGCQGRISDGGVLKNSSFWQALVQDTLGIPEPALLPQSQDDVWNSSSCSEPVPYYFVGDDAFPLEVNIMKPYPQRNLSEEKRIFNYRLSRARRISENVFGILSSRFRIFMSTLCVKPENAVTIVMAALALHNFLRSKVPGRYTPPGTVDSEAVNGNVEEGSWRCEIQDTPFLAIPNSRKGRQARKAEDVRDQLCRYVNGPGQVPWQWRLLL